MECILLGTGGMMPMPYRLLTSLTVRLKGELYVFDAGEGAQLGFKKARLGVRGLKLLAVTHLHADHCLGIPGLMMLKAQMEAPSPFTIIGPPGIEEFIIQTWKNLEFHINYPVRFVEWSQNHSELAYQDNTVRIFWHPLRHTRLCLGYRMEEVERPGKFHSGKAEALGIPRGPLWGKLQRGEKVISETGEAIGPDQVLGPPRRGRHLAFVVDTRPCKGVYRLCNQVDAAFIEGMFLEEDTRHANAKGHLTVVEAAKIARKAGARRAILIHISPRYENEILESLEAEAREHFDAATVGKDLDVYPIPFMD